MATVTKFKTPYDAGFDAGKFGANNFNSHFSWFNTKERMEEWSWGKKDGLAKRESDRYSKKSKHLKK